MTQGTSVSLGGHPVKSSVARVTQVANALGTRGKNNDVKPSGRAVGQKPTGKNFGGVGTA